MAPGRPANAAWALAIAEALAAQASLAVVSPGSRSGPLARALDALVPTAVLVDERVAGFFALGVAKATGRPAIACTTSGTAVANLLPAAIEADHAAAPLVLLTADRPPSLRGTGANQTIVQPGLFGATVRYAVDLPVPPSGPLPRAAARDVQRRVADALVAALGVPPGPVHLNVPFAEPLEPSRQERAALDARAAAVRGARAAASRTAPRLRARPADAGQRHAARRASSFLGGLRGDGAIVVGPRPVPGGVERPFVDALHRLARATGAVILADPLSGVRHAPGAGRTLSAYDAYLGPAGAPGLLRPEWILQLGASPTSKALRTWMAGLDAPRLKVDEHGRGWNDVPGHVDIVAADAVLLAEALAATAARSAKPRGAGRGDHTWRTRWAGAEAAARRVLDAALSRHAGSEPAAVAATFAALRPRTALVIGNSLPVRDLDRFVPSGPARDIHFNRGASGIDGLLATAAGVAHARGPTVALVGDLSFQHDLGALAAVRASGGRLRVVVLDNGGGQIFRHLPGADATRGFERLFVAPQDLDVTAAARAFGLRSRRARPSGIARALGQADVVHVPLDGPASVEIRRRAAQEAGKAARAALEALPARAPAARA